MDVNLECGWDTRPSGSRRFGSVSDLKEQETAKGKAAILAALQIRPGSYLECGEHRRFGSVSDLKEQETAKGKAARPADAATPATLQGDIALWYRLFSRSAGQVCPAYQNRTG